MALDLPLFYAHGSRPGTAMRACIFVQIRIHTQDIFDICALLFTTTSQCWRSDCFIMDDTCRDEDFYPGHSSFQQKRSEPEPSCVSMRSDRSMGQPIYFRSGDTKTDLSSVQQNGSEEESSCESMRSDSSINQPFDYKSEDTKTDLRHEVLNKFRLNLMKKFGRLYEGTATQGNPTLLNEVYTELYITESESGEISNEHEVRQIETQSRKTATEDTAIKCNDIFRPLPGQDKAIRTVLTKGVAGIGKTVSVQKFILDWAEGKENQDIQLIFPLSFREINLMKDKTLSVSVLLHVFFPETKEMDISSDEHKVLFIFDGLDECRLSLDIQSDVRLCDVSESASVDVLLMNLIVGNLLPSALIWITSRPAAADLIPSECVHRVTEVRGFNDPQKEEYFRKRISDQSLANAIISHLKSSRSLYIMCHIPVFCWISAAVLEKMLSRAESGKIPKTLTQMYTHFLILQTNIKYEKDYKKVRNEDMILKLGKLAFQQLVKGNLIFYEEDLRECGIDVTEASVYSGLCTQIFREEFGLYQGKIFCFVHLSIQEHLAAVYVHLSWTNHNRSAFQLITKLSLRSKVKDWFQLNSPEHVSLSELHQKAVNEALQSKNGHLDLFLRFLLGLSVESHEILLKQIMTLKTSSSDSNEKTVEYIKKKCWTIDSPEKSINLFHCLNELGDHSLVEQIQHYLKSGRIKETKLSSSQWSAVVSVLLTSEKKLEKFDINEFVCGKNKTNKLKVLQKLLPVVKESRSVQLNYCGVTDEGCAALASALRSNPSHLRQLDLSGNKLGKTMNLLSDVLQNPHCKLEILWLNNCGVTDEGCAALASALRSNPSHLRELSLIGNKIGDQGVKFLCAVLEDPHCKLEKLRLMKCGITDEGCAALASALRSNPSHLRELSLFWNEVGKSGVKLLSDLNILKSIVRLNLFCCSSFQQKTSEPESRSMRHPLEFKSGDTKTDLRHEVLNTFKSNLMKKFERLHEGTVTQGNPTLLNEIYTELYITEMESHQILLKGFMKQTRTRSESNKKIVEYIKIKIRTIDPSEKNINLFHCLNELGDHSLVEEIQQYLKSGTIKEVELSSSQWSALVFVLLTSEKKLDDFDINKFVGGNNKTISLEVLLKLLPVIKESRSVQLSDCGVTDEGCAALTSALRSNPSHLRHLDLSRNKLLDFGAIMLSAVLKDPRCKPEKLWLVDCGITGEGCAALASALRSNPSHLTELDLSWNKLGDSVYLLSDVLQNPHCQQEILGLRCCGVTDEGCAALASALRSNPSHLRELDLSRNKLLDSGATLLSVVLEDPRCKPEKLLLNDCGATDEGCAALASALRSNSSHLRELSLSRNKLGDSVYLLSDVLQNPYCKMERLWLRCCGVTDEGCAALASALRLNPSHLRQLSLSGNKIGDLGVKRLCAVLKNPHCKLEKLQLVDCGITGEGCAALASALRSNSSHLRELSLSRNKLGDSVYLLSDVLQNPYCKMERLWLRCCGVTDEGCAALASALRSNPSHLRHLDLAGNKIGDLGVKHLCAGLKNPHCKLEKLQLMNCGVTDESCAALASALRLNRSHLRELNLFWNGIGKSGIKLLSDLKDDRRYKLETLGYCEHTASHCHVCLLCYYNVQDLFLWLADASTSLYIQVLLKKFAYCDE
ncbi:hypothetical protein QQF64_032685, partial [Cirrhinus molitorella]